MKKKQHFKPFRAVLTRPEADQKTDNYISYIRFTLTLPLIMKVYVQTEDVNVRFTKMKQMLKAAIDNLDLTSDELDEKAH